MYPEGPLGDQTFHRVTRYPQDVIINFVDEGYVYAFDPMAFLDAIVRLTVAFGALPPPASTPASSLPRASFLEPLMSLPLVECSQASCASSWTP